MGNIQSEVFPTNFISRRRKELHAVNRISMHQPARPQMKKFFLIVVIVFIKVVCAEIAKLCRENTHARLDKSHAFAYNVDDKAV